MSPAIAVNSEEKAREIHTGIATLVVASLTPSPGFWAVFHPLCEAWAKPSPLFGVPDLTGLLCPADGWLLHLWCSPRHVGAFWFGFLTWRLGGGSESSYWSIRSWAGPDAGVQ